VLRMAELLVEDQRNGKKNEGKDEKLDGKGMNQSR